MAIKKKQKQMTAKEWMEAYLKPLSGTVIRQVKVREDELGQWPVLVIQPLKGDVFEIEIGRDAEGNGPGFIFGLPRPE
jgi:hypothetical protein